MRASETVDLKSFRSATIRILVNLASLVIVGDDMEIIE